MAQQNDPQQLVDHLFRREAGKMVAVLTKLFGLPHVETAQDIVQETLLSALDAWRLGAVPENPRAWLYRAAKNKALDQLRRQRNWTEKIAPNIVRALSEGSTSEQAMDQLFLESEIEDSQLRMLFACCHTDLPVEGQIALMLKTLCGLSVAEIASAFLTGKDNIEKRLYRTREKIRVEGIGLEVPLGAELQPRLDGVLKAIYLLFNEGYHSSSKNELIRWELCDEALRLSNLLCSHAVVGLPKTHALRALLCFQASRFGARMDAGGQIVLLEQQDRTLWDQMLIAKGFMHLTQSATGGEVSEYHLEAAIASYHAQAKTFEQTNWQAIFYLYQLLYQRQPSPVIAFNRAIALGYANGVQLGLDALLAIEGMNENHFYQTALGDFYQKTGDLGNTKKAYEKALKLAFLPREKQLLTEKLVRVQQNMEIARTI